MPELHVGAVKINCVVNPHRKIYVGHERQFLVPANPLQTHYKVISVSMLETH